ncbi:MAG TPA: NAD(P)/FAD-dependent oxidoreductase [Methanoregulaceae archaeon]|nr:NAD(P)/FAD-dependent oxidoreductase [Methanoregulaceae archaeon]
MTPKTVFRAIIVGGGPAGLFCAIHASSGYGDILLIEKNPGPGRKLLITGSGQCNITHGGAIRDFLSHYGEHGRFITPALLNFPNSSLTLFFKERGLETLETEGGKIFPVSWKSQDVLSVLVKECQSKGTWLIFNEPVTCICREDDVFRVETGSGRYYGRNVVIATGGITYPETGSTGDGYRFARSCGHTVTETAPALTPVIIEEFPFADLPGISFRQASITVRRGGAVAGSGTGDLLFTHRGLSGPGVLDCSRYIRAGDVLNVSFVPVSDRARLETDLMKMMNENPVSRIAGIITSLGLPERFVSSLLAVTGIPAAVTCSHISRQQRKDIIGALMAFPFTVQSLGGPREAMVTRGGVHLPEINPKTMESRLVPGMFFIGEVLDIDGDTGGYNLQAAFSTGYLAGITIRDSDT